jgi:hypothetical protein
MAAVLAPKSYSTPLALVEPTELAWASVGWLVDGGSVTAPWLEARVFWPHEQGGDVGAPRHGG